MNILSELFDDLKFILKFRKRVMKQQLELNRLAPKAGDSAPDFTLFDIEGKESVTLSGFRDKTPVALVFGSFT